MGSFLSYVQPNVQYITPSEMQPSDKSVSKSHMMFILNNLPHVVHETMFLKYPQVCPKYYHIKIVNDEIIHHADDIDSALNLYRFIGIRVDIYKKTIHHINMIILDTWREYVLYFEPQGHSHEIARKICDTLYLPNYVRYEPEDMGVGWFNRLQYLDALCQTYAPLAYLVIINNPDKPISAYGDIMYQCINEKSINGFFYYLDTQLKRNGFDIQYVHTKMCSSSSLISYVIKKWYDQTKSHNASQLQSEENGDVIIHTTK